MNRGLNHGIALMSNVIDYLKYAAENKAYEKGIKIYVKTDLGKEVLVYDAQKPVSQTTGETNDLIKVGITVKDKNGSVITNYGGNPKTNYLKVGLVVTPMLVMGFLMLRGIIR